MGEGAPHWAIVWDDCVRTGGLQPTVQNELVPLFRAAAGRRLCFTQFFVGGWSGVHENAHGCCILTTLELPQVMSDEGAAAPGASSKAAASGRKLFETARRKASCA